MKTKILFIVLAVFISTGCSGMKKPNLNKIFNTSQSKAVSTSSDSGSKDDIKSSNNKETTSTVKEKHSNDLILMLDAWIQEHMW